LADREAMTSTPERRTTQQMPAICFGRSQQPVQLRIKNRAVGLRLAG